MKRVHIITYGCQMNKSDSEMMNGLLRQKGYLPAAAIEEADLILVNTCSVRAHAESRALGRLGELARLKRKRPDIILGVCGCMAERQRDHLLQKAPYLDFILGPRRLAELPEIVDSVNSRNSPLLCTGPERDPSPPSLHLSLRENNLKAWLPISLGCNNFCAYCIVPSLRGPLKSRDSGEIIKEAESLAENGYREVTLLGQNVNAYGQDRPGEIDFAGLLEQLNAVAGLSRIRFATSHPKDISSRVIDALADLPSVCEALHLPIQAGSNNVLARMKRGYTVERYLEIISQIREKIPKIAISTDIIVGFPGETEDDFEATLALVEEAGFDGAFTFKYSPRPGTPAAEMPDQIPEEVRKARLDRLIKLQNRITQQKNEALIGSEQEVLVEGKNPKRPGFLLGRTRTDKTTTFAGHESLIGQIVNVNITKATTWCIGDW
ncbi:MAG: tRNA (N6-isopentenyl adenosine(37)-C2)-methylthiotransferase MiaB [bacterium]